MARSISVSIWNLIRLRMSNNFVKNIPVCVNLTVNKLMRWETGTLLLLYLDFVESFHSVMSIYLSSHSPGFHFRYYKLCFCEISGRPIIVITLTNSLWRLMRQCLIWKMSPQKNCQILQMNNWQLNQPITNPMKIVERVIKHVRSEC